MTRHPKYDEGVPEGHPSVEMRPGMCSKDQLLRRHGFKIARRPAEGEAVWVRCGAEYTQSEALRAISNSTQTEKKGGR
jgi:hypothetical protein